jgi:HrpA-like RNA helicase
VDPKLGKMLIMGAIFRCFDPVLTIVSGLSVRDPFLLPQDKKDVSEVQHIICWCFKICSWSLQILDMRTSITIYIDL